jgi:hypothetical protein
MATAITVATATAMAEIASGGNMLLYYFAQIIIEFHLACGLLGIVHPMGPGEKGMVGYRCSPQ